MNKIYKVVWNKARGCYVVGSELMKTHQGKKSQQGGSSVLSKVGAALLLGIAGWGAACNFIYADVTVADSKYNDTINKTGITGGGTQYDIRNQQVKGNSALNRFNQFDIAQKDVANMHLEAVDHQINIVNQKMNVDGVVNALKNNQIGGDVYFFSDKGIAVGSTGVFNVGRLTLGTNAQAGQVLFDKSYTMNTNNGPILVNVADKVDQFYKASAKERGQTLNDFWNGNSADKNATITVAGRIYAADSVVLANREGGTNSGHGTGISVASGAQIQTGTVFRDFQAGQTADHYRSSLINTSSVKNATSAIATADGIALVADKDISVSGDLISHGRTIDAVTKDNLYVQGAKVQSDGGKISLTASSSDAKLQADPKDTPLDGMISIKDAYIDSTSTTKDSGTIEITAVRNVMGVSRVTVDDSTIDASGKNGKNAGNVAIHATADTQLYAWDIGDGAYAQIQMGKNSSNGNTIKGDNIDIAAKASTTGTVGDDGKLTDAEIEANVQKEADKNSVLGFIKDFGGNLRTVGSVTSIAAGADVDIEKTDMTAVGSQKADQAPHGNVTITSEAQSSITPKNYNFIGFGFNAGIGTVDSHVNVDHSRITAAKDISMKAEGTNTVDLALTDLNLTEEKTKGFALDFSWAELHSDVSAKVGQDAVLTSQGNTELSATSTRTLASNVDSGGSTLAMAGAVGIADTKATATMAGTIYAGGAVSVKAENTLAESGGVYTADTVSAASASGDSATKPTEDSIKGGAKTLLGKLKDKFAGVDKTGAVAKDVSTTDQTAQSKPWNKLGANASTALLFSDNEATASVTGKVRGVDAAGQGNDTIGAKSLDVASEVLSRSKATVASYQNDTTEDNGTTTKKDATITASVAYMQQKNHAESFISGDTKTVGDTSVTAETKMPWQTSWQSTSVTDVLSNLMGGLTGDNPAQALDLVDGWSQAAGNGDKVNGAASITVVNYDNSAKAYIGKKDSAQTTAPQVEAGGDVKVEGTTDITTANFAGSIQPILKSAPINIWKTRNLFRKNGWNMEGASKAGVGGSALAVHQKNKTEAYIDDGAIVKATGDVDVNAKTKATNIAISTSGGMAKTVALDASVSVNMFDNETKATIGNATVSGKNVGVSAQDDSKDINLAGGVGVSGGTGIGASIAYNHIIRDTEAAIHGKVDAQDAVKVQAKNTGEIIAASVAGAVAYDNKTTKASSGNGAGSSGFHAVESGDSDSSSLEDLVDSMAGEKTKLSESADSSISQVAGKDSSMNGNTSQAKGGLAASANVSVNRIKDNAKAYVAKKEGETTRPSVTADVLRVTGLNDSAITTTSAAISANLHANAGTSVAGSFMYNSIEGNNSAYVEGADLTLRGNQKQDENGQDIDEALTVQAENQEHITNIAASGSGATKGASVAGQISLNWVDNTTDAHVKDSTIRADEAMNIAAKDSAAIDSYTGAVSVSTGSSAVGAAIAVNLIEGENTSYVENTEVSGTATDKKGDLSVTAEEASKITSIVASGSAANNMAASFSASGNWIHTETDAHISNAKDMKTGALSVKAGNHSTATLGVGNAAVGNNAAGASIAVMVNDSTVSAQLTGDANKQKKIVADGITVEADNAYNGSASDSNSDSAAKTVAVGAAGGASQFAGSGSVTVNVISQKTDASLGKGLYEAGTKDVSVTAKNTAKLFGMAGGLALSGGTGIGAAVDVQTYKGHTYAGIEDGAKLQHAKSVTVQALSEEKMTSVAATGAGGGTFGGAGAAGAHSISTDTKAYIGNQEDTTINDADKAELTDAGEVTVQAKDTTKLLTTAGAAGAAGTAGVGLTAAVEVVNQKTSAYVGNHAKVGGKSLTVEAETLSDSTTLANGLGAGGTAGVAGAASETFVNQTTKAYVGKVAQVTTSDAVDIHALSNFKQGAEAGGVGAAGTVGIGLSNSTVSLKADTQAYADAGAIISGGKKVNLSADHTSDLTYATLAGGVGGTVGVSGNVGVNILDTTTKAYVGEQTEISAEEANAEGISITATDTTKLNGGNGGASIGITGGGAGAAIAVTNIKKDTEAYVGKEAKLDTIGKLNLAAKNTENMTNVSVQAGGGLYAGLAGAVNVVNLTAVTKAFTDTGVLMNQNHKQGGDISVTATHEIEKMENAAGGAAVSGGGSVGAAVDVVNIKTQTNAYLGDGNKVQSNGNVSIQAEDNMHDIASRAVAASVGAFGLSGSISIYNIGSTMSAEDQKNLTGKTSSDGADTDFDSWVNDQLNQSGTSKAMKAYDSGALTEVQDKLDTTFASEAPSSTGEKGTLAKVGQGTIIEAGGAVTVKADDTLQMTNTMGNISGGVSSAGMSVSVVRTDTQTKALVDKAAQITATGNLDVLAKADHTMNSVIAGASVSGGVSGQGTVQTWRDHSDVYALMGDTQGVKAKNISISAVNNHNLDATLAGAAVALSGALNGAVIDAKVSGKSDAGIGEDSGNSDSSTVEATENLTISSTADTKLKAKAVGAAAGAFAGTGTGVTLASDVDTRSFVGKGENLKGKTISITSENTPQLDALATSAGVGIAGIGATVAIVKSQDDAKVVIADGASLTAAEDLTIQAQTARPKNGTDYNAYAHAIAGGGGVIAGAVSVVDVTLDQDTETTVGKNVTIQAKKATIAAKHNDAANLEMESVSAGSYSGTGGETNFTVKSDAKVSVGDGSAITTTDETVIQADNQTTKDWLDGKSHHNAYSGGAALANGNGVVSQTDITHTTLADVGKVTIKANAAELTEEEKANGMTIHDKNAIAIDAHSQITAKDDQVLTTGAVVGAAHIKNTLTAKATTETKVADGATLLAGDTEKAKATYTETVTSPGTVNHGYRGGSISVGSRNDANLSGNTLVDVFGAAGYAGSENNVTYQGQAKTTFGATAETAKGDIFAMAGRDSQGETGTIHVNAHSDILNATAIPISYKKDPVAKIDSHAQLAVTTAADMKSDRDIGLKAKAGNLLAIGSGEVKDWVNQVAEAFGSEGGQMGKKEISSSANVSMDGKAETGIHRNQKVTIGGTDANGTWTTTIEGSEGISYTFSGAKPVGSTLYERLHELQQKLADYSGDPAAKAAYEAEIAFLEEKMAAQGLGYFETDTAGNRRFIELQADGKSELETAKEVLKNAKDSLTDAKNVYQKRADESQAQMDRLTSIMDKKNDYDRAVSNVTSTAKDAAQKKTEMDAAKETLDTTEATVKSLADREGLPIQDYVIAYESNAEVQDYVRAKRTYADKESAYNRAYQEAQEAPGYVENAKTNYRNAATDYNTTYQDSIPTDVTEVTDDVVNDLYNKKAAASTELGKWNTQKDLVDSNYTNLQNQIAATEAFFANGGTENGGEFIRSDGTKVEEVTYNGETYYLLHKDVYQQMTHDVELGTITSQLGDILLEGDNVSGRGTMTAGGNATVSIINNSPNNLVTGDITVIGRGGTAGAGQGGTIFFNDVEMKGNTSAEVQEAIKKANKDTTASVSMDIKTRYQTDGPTITIDNQFRPQGYVDTTDNSPLYGASETQLKGYIYNPRGQVKVTSANGDVYNNGSIYAGTVDMVVSNGDFIQSFPEDTTGTRSSISSIGGNPLDDSGNRTTTLGTGILANGNIFISARYVNINSKIQSGVANWNIEIPSNYKLYYMDGSNRMDISDISQVPQGKTILVADGSGKTIDNLSYDRANDRFVLSDVEVHGGKVSIVGTIINTTNDTSKARIEALDGYGSIQVTNNTQKDLELKTISTGSGVEGQIEITDLDRKTGKITRKTTYTRDNGQIKMTVQNYTDGQPSGTAQDTTFDKDKEGIYKTADGAYYTLQTGKDKTYSTTYELHETKMDWWGIEDKEPTGQDMLDKGGTITDVKNGAEYTLNGGAFVSESNDINGSGTGEVYKESSKTFNAETKSTFTKKSKRLWYTIGLAKKYDYKLVEEKRDTTITQHSLKADYDIGIGFNGNESGGTLNVNGGNGNLIINGTLSNGRGTTEMTSGSITQGALGYVDTGTLKMTATTGSAGTKDAAIRTSADKVSGSAVNGDWAVKVADHGVTIGNVTAGKTLSIQAENGISQEAGTVLDGSRIELSAGAGAIQGVNGAALEIKTKQGVGKDYGLKASAEGDISINHTGGDLYLDSVISSAGDVSLTTEGSFIDNNLDDVIDESAKEKLLAWANAAVLEGSTATVEKQKNLLIAKVQEKYNEYQSLSAYVKDGKYTLDDSTKEALRQNGVTDIDAYILEKQSRYEALKDSVGTWTKDGVEAYVKSIQDSTDGIYGNASLTKAQLTGDAYLTADEKANILVGSAKSAKDLLLTFTPGGIKEGITDTNPIIKGTPHVFGKNVTLTAGMNGSSGNPGSGDIGKKETGKVIDLSAGHIENLTAEELLALSAAERGDFQLSGDTVTVSTVRSIDAEVSGKLTAKAENGSIYLVSEGAIKNGSELTAGKELRLKAAGDLDGITVSANDQTVLEAGEGKISDVKVKGNGILTARAKDGVTLSKDDGNMRIHTIYAAEGDVNLNLHGNSLIAETSESGEEEDTLHMEGENITIENAKDVKGKDDTSVGMKVTGKTDANGQEVAGSITAHVTDTMKVALFGTLAKDTQTSLSAKEMTITNHGIISGGTYQGANQLHVTNKGLIDGGTFTGNTVQVNNQDRLGGGHIQGTQVTLDNQGTVFDGTVTASDTLTISNQGTGTIEKGTFSGGNTIITNAGKVAGGDYLAKTGDLTYCDTSAGSMIGGHLTAEEGNVFITAQGALTVDSIQAKKSAKVTSEKDANLKTVTAGSIDLDVQGNLQSDSLTSETADVVAKAGGNLTANTIRAKRHAMLTSGGKMTIGQLTAEEDATLQTEDQLKADTIQAKKAAKVTSKGDAMLATVKAGSIDLAIQGNLRSDSLTSTEEDVVIQTGGSLTADEIQSNRHAELTSHGNMLIGKLKTTGNGKATSETGDVDIAISDIGKILSINAGRDVKLSQSDSVQLDVVAGRDILATTPNAKISSGTVSMEAEDSIRITDKNPVNKLAGVDTTQTAGPISGSGNAGSLISGEGSGHTFDENQKGSALLESTTGPMSLKAKKLEADTLKVGAEGTTKTPAELHVDADYVGIDDLQSAADRLHVILHGKDGQTQSRYAGIHTTADGEVLLKDSGVEHLNFTGKDRIGLLDTAIGGDSVLATEKATVTIKKNPGNTQAEWVGDLFLDGLDIRSDRRFNDIRNGLTINGERFPETASTVMKRSLYGRDYLGKDGQEKEKEDTQDTGAEMIFGTMTEQETYEVVGK